MFLVGAGSSLCGFPLKRLQGRAVLVVNDSALYLPWAGAVFSEDPDWIRERLPLLPRAGFTGERYVAVAPDWAGPRLPGVRYLRRSRERGLSTDSGEIFAGGSSGYGALNLAVLLGYRRIVLLGYDYFGPRWYDDKEPSAMMDSWAAEFRYALPTLRQLGVRVVNASRESRIDCFPKSDPVACLEEDCFSALPL